MPKTQERKKCDTNLKQGKPEKGSEKGKYDADRLKEKNHKTKNPADDIIHKNNQRGDPSFLFIISIHIIFTQSLYKLPWPK